MADNENLGAPQSRNEALLQNILGASYDIGEPQSRNEALLMKIAGEDVDVDFEPQSRIEALLMEIIDQGGGGGVEVEPLSVTENGTYTAETGKAYSPVTVDVQGGGGYTNNDFADLSKPVGAVTILDTTVQPAEFYKRTGITKIYAPNLTSVTNFNYSYSHNFYGCTALEEVDIPNSINFYDKKSVFEGCTNLRIVKIPRLTALSGSLFKGCESLGGVVFPNMSHNNNGYADIHDYSFGGCTSLEYADFGSTKNIKSNGFNGCTNLNILIIRFTPTSDIPTLDNINAFTGTPFASGGTGGTLYVPSSWISTIQSATNWSTIFGYVNNQIKSIEGSIYETQYADGTPIS